ncbi:uncharacterized protein BCR38DRAFT_110004 [Pseudomassariella vexata]|uniref:Uncharacterized protein n=1 Tax=Pseudomassariella vexata TaxID=1141098 RepID=A0A1Y2DD97_9PEZI|nr:uncharacterized protein BCR38DRAFT_110004 [Pseudomassariella vexata]ORY57240.1 hypothetical protein BCR38DRAFT_110004 [Pseudomassariella vexata]
MGVHAKRWSMRLMRDVSRGFVIGPCDWPRLSTPSAWKLLRSVEQHISTSSLQSQVPDNHESAQTAVPTCAVMWSHLQDEFPPAISSREKLRRPANMSGRAPENFRASVQRDTDFIADPAARRHVTIIVSRLVVIVASVLLLISHRIRNGTK